MGRQIGFYATVEDEADLLAEIRRLGGCILPAILPDPTPVVFESWPSPETCPRWDEMCTALLRHTAGLRTYHNRDWRVDLDNSNAVELSRCYQVADAISDGRLWAEMYSYLWDPELEIEVRTPKPPEFKHYFEALGRWIRKQWTRDPGMQRYCGPGAVEFVRAGGTLEQGLARPVSSRFGPASLQRSNGP